MDFQKFAETISSPTGIISVEKLPDGSCGDIRIVTGNRSYLKMIEMRLRSDAYQVQTGGETSFVPHSLYDKYFPKNRNFEEICFRAAVQETPVHTYVYLDTLDIWFDIYAIPLKGGTETIRYCTYTAVVSKDAENVLSTAAMAQTSNDVLQTCIRLHGADNLSDAMAGVISEIRRICKAECCTVLLMNEAEQNFSILATDFAEDSKIKRVTQFEGYYHIAASWADMIGGETDCIIIKDQKDMEYISRINNPWYQTLVEAGVRSVVLFPLRQGDEVLGYIWATNFDTNETMRIKETLELTTFFISSHIARYKVLQRLQHMSYTDALTGLPNRFACTEYIGALIREKKRFTAVSIDLNHFKSINDSLGLDAGNQVLIEISERWKALTADSCGTKDYIARIDGDEFLLVISGYDTDQALLDAIIRYVEALSHHLTVEGCDLYVRASFGYAEYPTDAGTADALISHANAAMNEIKKANSSDHILRFTAEILRDEHTLEIESKIRSALANSTVFFHLQPQYNMAHELRGFEALARMKDSDGSMIPPGEFVPIAEKVGLIDKVDSMVFRKATTFFSRVIRKTNRSLTLSLNASVRHLMNNGFIEEIRALLDKTGIAPEQLEIEITESVLIDSADKALQCINELKHMGIKLAIDDFGTGYSSLSYLNKFPADLLKIDKSFIDKITTNERSKQYVAAMISMGHIMGLDVISEGVEEPEQLEALRSIGCDLVQGFIWGRPLSAEDAEKLVTDLS